MLTSRARNKVKKVTWSISRYQASTHDLRNFFSSVLRLRLNDANDENDVTCDGRLFHAWAAATGNARPPSVFRWKRGTTRLAVEADSKVPSRHNLRHAREFVGEVARRQSMEASVDQHRQLVVDPIGITKPVQITEVRCHVLDSMGSVKISRRRRVEHGPQSVHQPIRDAGECGIAVVKARQHQWYDERHKDWPRNRRTNAAESSQHRETAGHHFWDMSPHADVTVQIYSEVSDRIGRNNDVDADTQTGLWNLMLTSNGCTPEHFRLGCVELKTIGLHPLRDVIHASRNPLLQLQDIRRRRVAADLHVVSVQMRNEVMLFDEPQQIGGVKKKKNRPKDWALRDTAGQSRWSRLRRAATDKLSK